MQYKRGGYLNQIIAAIFCNLAAFNYGQTIGWSSPAIPQIKSPSNPIGEISLFQSSLLVSSINITVIIFLPIIADIVDRIGRKTCLLLATIPFMINGLLIVFFKNINILIISRFILGIGIAGIRLTIPIYIGEIASPEIRGTLYTFWSIFSVIGISFIYCIGGYISYIAGGWAIFLFGLLNCLLFSFIPETPIFLLKYGKTEKALQSISWYYNIDPNSLKMKEKVYELQILFDKKKLSLHESFKIIVNSKPMRRSLLLCMFLILGSTFSGVFACTNYSVTIFMKSGIKNFTPENSALIYSGFQICGAFLSTWLIDKAGRKILLVTSSIGIATGMIITGIYFQTKDVIENDAFRWTPIVAMSFCGFMSTVGSMSIPLALISDTLIIDVRSFATMVLSLEIHLLFYLMLQFFEFGIMYLGENKMFYLFGICALCTAIITMLCLAETKGKTVEENMDINYIFQKKLKISSI